MSLKNLRTRARIAYTNSTVIIAQAWLLYVWTKVRTKVTVSKWIFDVEVGGRRKAKWTMYVQNNNGRVRLTSIPSWLPY